MSQTCVEITCRAPHAVILVDFHTVPDLDRHVRAHGRQDVVRRRVEAQQSHLPAVAVEIDERFRQRFSKAIRGDAPDLYRRVLRRRRDDVLVERVKVQIQHGRLVARDERRAGLVLADIFMFHDGEGAAAALQRDGEEGRVRLDVLLLARDRG